MTLAKFIACLAVGLILSPAGDAWAQSPPQSPPQPPAAQGQQQAAPETTPRAEANRQKTGRKGRKTRTPRTSTRRPSSSSQGLLEPARLSRDGGPSRRELTLVTTVVGGYDDNLAAGVSPGASTAAPMTSGPTGNLNANLAYFQGNTRRAIRMESNGSLQAYPGYLERPATGGFAIVDGKTMLGRGTTLRGSERVGYEPLFSVFSPGAISGPLPPGAIQAVPATGLFERQSWSSHTAVSINRDWTRRRSVTLSYAYRTQRFTDDNPGDNTSHDASMEYRESVASAVRARGAYRYVDTDYVDYGGIVRPVREHRMEAGPEIEMTRSRRHRLMLSFAAGASYVESIGSVNPQPYHAWVPIGSANLNLGLSPFWSIDGGYRRGFSLLRGITDQVYTPDTAYVTTTGPLTIRTSLRLDATYSNWKTSLTPGVYDTFNVYGASAAAIFAINAKLSATARYSYYYHRYSNPGALPAGFPAEYDRHAVTVGLTMAVPLAGTPPLSSPQNPRRPSE